MLRRILLFALVLPGCRGVGSPAAPASTATAEPAEAEPAEAEPAAAEPEAAEPAAPEPAAAEPAAPEPEAAEPAAPAEPEAPSALAQALSRAVHAPVRILETLRTPDGIFVTFRFNTLEAHLAGLAPEPRAQAVAQMERSIARCEALRKAARASTTDAWELDRIERETPCDVLAAEGLITRPRPTGGKRDFSSAPASELSPRCDALGIALADADDRILAHRVLTRESCVDRVEPLERRDFIAAGRPQVVVTASHEEWRMMPWGWSVDQRERVLRAFDLRRGELTEVLALSLDLRLFRETLLVSSCRYTVDAPGVVTRYHDAWNSLSGGIEVDRIRWDRKRRRWREPKEVADPDQEIPAKALPLDRPSD